jgi:hypothetical protein
LVFALRSIYPIKPKLITRRQLFAELYDLVGFNPPDKSGQADLEIVTGFRRNEKYKSNSL